MIADCMLHSPPSVSWKGGLSSCVAEEDGYSGLDFLGAHLGVQVFAANIAREEGCFASRNVTPTDNALQKRGASATRNDGFTGACLLASIRAAPFGHGSHTLEGRCF